MQVFPHRLIAGLLLIVSSIQLYAHEAWIEPFEYHLGKSSLVRGHLRAGQLFSGSTQLYDPDRFVRFDSVHKGKVTSVRGRLGDLPAIRHKLKKPGLHVLVYQSTGNVINYPEWEKFKAFSDKEGVAWVQQAHIDRRLPRSDFNEIFVRYAKSLINWKGTDGYDSATGMPFEIVALQNPYLDNAKSLTVQVLWLGSPVDGGQLTVFTKQEAADTVRSIVSLDAQGKATLALSTDTAYLLNTVSMEPLEGNKRSPVWKSHWASMTFRIEN